MYWKASIYNIDKMFATFEALYYFYYTVFTSKVIVSEVISGWIHEDSEALVLMNNKA